MAAIGIVNALIAIESAYSKAALALADSAKSKIGTGAKQKLSAGEEKALKALNIAKNNVFLKADISSKKMELLDILIDEKELSKIGELIQSAVVVGAWNPDGSQYGTTIVIGVDGVETIVGTPIYPLHPKLLDFMPDDVVYDENGLEVSRKRPTKLKQVHKYLGWADRRWT